MLGGERAQDGRGMVGFAVIFWILNCGTGVIDENFYKTEFQSKGGLL